MIALTLSLFCCLVILLPQAVQAQQIPNCQSTYSQMLGKVTQNPAIKDLQGTLNLAASLGDMSNGEIRGNLDSIGTMLDAIEPDQIIGQMSTVGDRLGDTDLETIGILGGSIDNLMTGSNLNNFDSKLREVSNLYRTQYQNETDPAKKEQYAKRVQKLNDVMRTWSDMPGAVQQSHQSLSGKLQQTGIMSQINNANTVLNQAARPSTIGSNVSGLLGNLSNIDNQKLGNIRNRIDSICGLMTGGTVGDLVKNVISSYGAGLLAKAQEKLKEIATQTLTKLKDRVTGEAKEKTQEAIDSITAGALQSAKDTVESAALDGAIAQLGGVTQLLGSALTGGVGGVVGDAAAGAIGSAAGTAIGSAAGGTIGSITGMVSGVANAARQSSCLLPKPHEVIDCPQIECDPNIALKGVNSGSEIFIQRVEKYFKHQPDPKVSRIVYEAQNYQVNKAGERKRPPAAALPGVADVANNRGNIIDNLLQGIENQLMRKIEQALRQLVNGAMAQVKGQVNQVLSQHGHNLPDEKLDRWIQRTGNDVAGLSTGNGMQGAISSGQVSGVLNRADTDFRKMLKEEGITIPDTDIASVNRYLNGQVNTVAGKLINGELVPGLSMDRVLNTTRDKLNGLFNGLTGILPQSEIDRIANGIVGDLAAAGVTGDLSEVTTILKAGLGLVRDGCTDITFRATVTGPIVEPCQDNRWRDTCLIGELNVDKDYPLGRNLQANEEVLGGHVGSSTVYDKKSNFLNCLVPKHTPAVSPLLLREGWGYRKMCPGNKILRRVQNDEREEALDILSGVYGCLAPLPKCDLQNDWQKDTINWKNAEYGSYLASFNGALGSAVGGFLGVKVLAAKLKALLNNEQFNNLEKLLNPQDSTRPECKPAFWVRLMLDSCANQYILQNARKAGAFNKDGRSGDMSPRSCQLFRSMPIELEDKVRDPVTNELREEYNVADYIRRSFKGLLMDDYMPYIEYDRHKGGFAAQSKLYRDQNWPNRKITWKDEAKAEFKKGYDKIPQNLSLTHYMGEPVERILDPLHPFSPRYDVAETIDGQKLIDRNLLEGMTESKATLTADEVVYALGRGLQKYSCIPEEIVDPTQPRGYFEDGCTGYCSAVEVDLLSFRYKDFSLCMKLQATTNTQAFWDEYDINKQYYDLNYCQQPYTHPECEYGAVKDNEVCGSCGLAKLNWSLYAVTQTTCATTGVGCKEAAEYLAKAKNYTSICPACQTGARAEALERTRTRSNKLAQPIWGPTAVGDQWPVCSTRFDHTGNSVLCRQAKQTYGVTAAATGTENDPNIARNTLADVQQCINKDYKEICHAAAKPIRGMNFLKIRTRMGDVRTDDEFVPPVSTPSIASRAGSRVASATNRAIPVVTGVNFKERVANLTRAHPGEDPAFALGFREYFGNRRPYMQWHDTGKEAFQVGEEPDYWCDWGQNDAVMGVGRDYNSIHGKQARLCRYGGGAGIGNSCFQMSQWTQSPHDSVNNLAGSKWAELKLYQANCFREEGLNCLCQFPKIYKDRHSEDAILHAMGASLDVKVMEDGKLVAKTISWPLTWRGWIDSHEKDERFPFGLGVDGKARTAPQGSIIAGGLDEAKVNDVLIWYSGSGKMPMAARVVATQNLARHGSLDKVPNKSRWVKVKDVNNGKYMDTCGNTALLGRGRPRYFYPNKDELPPDIRSLMEEQVAFTYYCDDPDLGHCVQRDWENQGGWMRIYRPALDEVVEPPT